MKRLLPILILILLISSCEKGLISDSSSQVEISLDSYHKMIQTRDGGFLIAGESDNKIVFIKTDKNLHITWERSDFSWGNNISGYWGSSSYGFHTCNIFELENGDFIIMGSVAEGGCVIMMSAIIIELSPSGREVKTKKIEDLDLIDVISVTEGGYLLYGTQMIRMNEKMEIEWKVNLYAVKNWIIKIVNMENGYFVVTCKNDNNSKSSLKIFDRTGMEIQSMPFSFNQPPMEEIGYGILRRSDNGFIIVGRSRNNTPPYDMDYGITRINPSGEKLWSSKFGNRSEQWLENIIWSSDKEFVVTGKIGYPNDKVQKSFLLRMNNEGMVSDSCTVNRFDDLFWTKDNYFIKAQMVGNKLILNKYGLKEIFAE
jgi:hypothetical protein